MCKRDAQRAVASHRKAGYPARFPIANDSIVRLDLRQELLKKKIAVAVFSVRRVDEEATASFRGDHNEVGDLLRALKIFDQPPSPATHERLLVFAEAVQKVEHGILSCFLVVIRGEHYAVAHGTVQNSAIYAGAIDATLRQRNWRQSEKQNDICPDSQHAAVCSSSQ